MRTNLLRVFAVAIGLTVSVSAVAQDDYRSPAQWSNFYPEESPGGTYVSAQEAAQRSVPGGSAEAMTDPLPAGTAMPTPDVAEDGVLLPPDSAEGCQSCQESTYSLAVRGRLPLQPWYGSTNLLFYTLAGDSGRWIASGLGTYTTGSVDPSGTLGFDATVGRYLGCGRFGLGLTYMLWNPSPETEVRRGSAGSIYATMPAYRDVSIDLGSVDPVYDYIDGTSASSAGAAGVRTSRDLLFQGIEVNLTCFGMLGARRVSRDCCPTGCCGRGLGFCNRCYGNGGITGPLILPRGSSIRIVNSHGFRWMQVKDDLEFAYNIDGTSGYQANDLYENIDVENNLFGYQFGSRISYCLTCRLNLNIGGKIGLYGNYAELRHRLGTQNTLAYRNGVSTDGIDTKSTDTTLATLGEFDLGLGYRIGCAWTIRGGYRLLGMTGVASAIDSITDNYATLAASGKVYANDSYLLHGGYLGLEYNW